MVTIDYFSDVLCVWAYGGQIRLDELRNTFPGRLLVRHHFMPLFADTRTRIADGWRDEGGFDGFGRHVREVCVQWEHTRVHDAVWSSCRPLSCVTAHLVLRAAAASLGIDDGAESTDTVLDVQARSTFDALIAAVREAFFEHALDIARLDVLLPLVEVHGIEASAIRQRLENGEAMAALHRDEALMKAHGVQGSPTYVFNEGRQSLYGNVGYRIIEANIRELLSTHQIDGAPSWC